MTVLSARDLRKSYAAPDGEIEILRGVSLDVGPGETVAVMGRSGCGKSTFLSLLAGLDRPTSGEVAIEGKPWLEVPPRAVNAYRARTIGLIFQQFYLLEHLTALENARLPLDLARMPDADRMASEQLRRVGLGHRLAHFPGQMSRGEQQRCAIARSLALRPKLLLADEPTGSLDARSGREAIDLVFALASEDGAAVVLATHDPSLAARCSRQLYLHAGLLSASVPEGFA